MKKNPTALGLNGFGWAHIISDCPYDFDAILQRASELGFDGIELFGLPDAYPGTRGEQETLRGRVEDHGLQVAAIQSLPGGLGNGHPASAYSLCRNQYVDYIAQVLEMADVLGCGVVGVWAGERFGGGPDKQQTQNMIEVYRRCAELAEKSDVVLVLEAEPVQLVHDPEIWLRILEGVDSPHMKALCDFAHINVLSREKPLELLSQLLPYVGYTHLCGNDGTCTDFESRSSTHLTLGQGNMDWRSMVELLLDGGYAGWLDIDLWEHPDPLSGMSQGKQQLDAFLSERAKTGAGA